MAKLRTADSVAPGTLILGTQTYNFVVTARTDEIRLLRNGLQRSLFCRSGWRKRRHARGAGSEK
jgi:hypothetical protein